MSSLSQWFRDLQLIHYILTESAYMWYMRSLGFMISLTRAKYNYSNSIITISSNQGNIPIYVGAIISNNVSWDSHYPSICVHAYHSLIFIRRNISLSTPQGLKKAPYTTSPIQNHILLPTMTVHAHQGHH